MLYKCAINVNLLSAEKLDEINAWRLRHKCILLSFPPQTRVAATMKMKPSNNTLNHTRHCFNSVDYMNGPKGALMSFTGLSLLVTAQLLGHIYNTPFLRHSVAPNDCARFNPGPVCVLHFTNLEAREERGEKVVQ